MTETTKENSPFKYLQGNSFRFQCHKGIACFTKCCADLKLVLTPYDILRAKKRLKLRSHEFLDRHTDTSFDPGMRFPRVLLKMEDNEGKNCPFVTSEGCTIYEDRPGACRIYPIGRASLKADPKRAVKEKFFMVQEEHCLGFQEDREWTIKEWMAGEGLDEYNAMNDKWLEILTSPLSLGPKKDTERKLQMFYMASYNLDRFRDFIFKSGFFQLFDVDSDLKDALSSNDVELLLFALDWLKFSLFGQKTIKLKQAL